MTSEVWKALCPKGPLQESPPGNLRSSPPGVQQSVLPVLISWEEKALVCSIGRVSWYKYAPYPAIAAGGVRKRSGPRIRVSHHLSYGLAAGYIRACSLLKIQFLILWTSPETLDQAEDTSSLLGEEPTHGGRVSSTHYMQVSPCH